MKSKVHLQREYGTDCRSVFILLASIRACIAYPMKKKGFFASCYESSFISYLDAEKPTIWLVDIHCSIQCRTTLAVIGYLLCVETIPISVCGCKGIFREVLKLTFQVENFFFRARDLNRGPPVPWSSTLDRFATTAPNTDNIIYIIIYIYIYIFFFLEYKINTFY